MKLVRRHLYNATVAGRQEVEALEKLYEYADENENTILKSLLVNASARLTVARVALAELEGDSKSRMEAIEQHEGRLKEHIRFIEALFLTNRRGGDIGNLTFLRCRLALLQLEKMNLKE